MESDPHGTYPRHAIGIPWPDTISSKQLHRRTDQIPIEVVIRRRKLQTRPCYVFTYGSRRMNGPRATKCRTVEEKCEFSEIRDRHKYIARNRQLWRMGVLCFRQGFMVINDTVYFSWCPFFLLKNVRTDWIWLPFYIRKYKFLCELRRSATEII